MNKGFTKSHADSSLYILQLCHYIYVDDLIILATIAKMFNELKYNLEHKFEMSDIGELHLFLGGHFERDRKIHIITMH